MEHEKCETCRYFEPIGNVGNCHRFPPPLNSQGISMIDDFTVVKKDYWCGEYKRKETK